MYRKLSRDVKLAAIRLWEGDLLALPDILNCCDFSRATFYRIVNLWQETGDVVSNKNNSHPRSRCLDTTDIQFLLQLVEENPDYFLDELLRLLKTNYFISVHYTTINNQLLRAGVSRKRLQHIASERNEDGCANFIARIAQYAPHEIGFINEVSKDERSVGRHFGRSRRGRRPRKSQPFVRGRRTSTVGCLTLDGFVSGTSVEGSFTKDSFLHWLEHSLVRNYDVFYPILSTNCHSCLNAMHTQVFSVSSSLTTQQFIMVMKFSSSLIGLASVSNTSPLTHLISTPLRKRFPKSSTS
jgi:transposase